MKLYKYFYFIFLLFFSSSLEAHTFTGMIGFYDGVSHPVLGLDHFLAMVSVGIISSQIGGKAIWKIPATFVLIMLLGGTIGIFSELKEMLDPVAMKLSDVGQKNYFIDYLYLFIEFGILISVILLGFSIAIDSKLPLKIIYTLIGLFGFFHGAAHGLEMPQAANPLLFAFGFSVGTATLHIFGVIIGFLLIKTKLTSMILRMLGIGFVCFGLYSIFLF